MSSSTSHPLLAEYLEGVARFLASFRAREGLTQNEMAIRLGLSLNRYREYEQNTTDNSKGVALDLLLKIADLENLDLPGFLNKIRSGVPSELGTGLEPWQEKVLTHFAELSLDERELFLQVLENPTLPDERARQLSGRRTDETQEPLMPRRVRWWVRLGALLCQLPYDSRLRFERQVLEDYIDFKKLKGEDPQSHQIIERLRELLKHYFTHFDLMRR
jgi:transcriptional regulator with XRE-family HTH domain